MKPSFRIVIPSKRHENLRACLGAIRRHEPELTPDRIMVVDDGAREGYPDAPVTWVRGVKPFVFSRNANLGIAAAAPSDVILINDDALLETRLGFHRMHKAVQKGVRIGACSASINGYVGNHNQKTNGSNGLRDELITMAFICVYLPRKSMDDIGPLDERFVGYGCEDGDYCQRLKGAQYRLVVFGGCVVEHGTVRSTFRSHPDIRKLSDQNRDLYRKKMIDLKSKGNHL
jgi:hypothetical protein